MQQMTCIYRTIWSGLGFGIGCGGVWTLVAAENQKKSRRELEMGKKKKKKLHVLENDEESLEDNVEFIIPCSLFFILKNRRFIAKIIFLFSSRFLLRVSGERNYVC